MSKIETIDTTDKLVVKTSIQYLAVRRQSLIALKRRRNIKKTSTKM